MRTRPFPGAVVPASPSSKNMAAAEEAVRADPGFQQIVSRLANMVVCRNNVPVPRSESVDDGLATQALDLAARLTLVACSGHASADDVQVARAAVDAAWKLTPVVVKTDDAFEDKVAGRAQPWQIALNKIFEQQTFFNVLAQDGLEALSVKKRGVAVVERILEQLASAGLELPRNFADAVRLVGSAHADLPPDVRAHVDRAAAFVMSLAPADGDGNVDVRIGWDKLGGRGAGRRLSPWRAASDFADAFDVRMPERLHDVTREK